METVARLSYAFTGPSGEISEYLFTDWLPAYRLTPKKPKGTLVVFHKRALLHAASSGRWF